MSNWEQKLLSEVREDVKAIREALPTLATKVEHDKLAKRVDRHGFIFNAVLWVGGGLWAIFKLIIDKLPHG